MTIRETTRWQVAEPTSIPADRSSMVSGCSPAATSGSSTRCTSWWSWWWCTASTPPGTVAASTVRSAGNLDTVALALLGIDAQQREVPLVEVLELLDAAVVALVDRDGRVESHEPARLLAGVVVLVPGPGRRAHDAALGPVVPFRLLAVLPHHR